LRPFFGKNPSRALLATQRKMSHFKGSESDTQKTQENDTYCGAWRDQAETNFIQKRLVFVLLSKIISRGSLTQF